MGDKFTRAGNLLKDGHKQAVEESLGDTLIDLANYALILKVYMENYDKNG